MRHTTESFQRIETIFQEALESPLEGRSRLIEVRCGEDRGLAAEVWSLLEACEEEAQVADSIRSGPEEGVGAISGTGRVGPYALDRLLGRGGMGAVYLAHRADGQFEQNVAIKLIDLPLATEHFRERFRQERQILAALQHPYIARLLDGGVTPAGDLFLVMEYVDGVPIHLYCENHKLPLRDRVKMFLRVCEAVEFAHHHFVVHRDLKPDNILVDQSGIPRLLDFGTAKLLSPMHGLSGASATREGFPSFTPQYASPEQVLGNPITTASDTYSLGVLLYQLLAGTPPYELTKFTTAEMLRVICQEPPRRPQRAVGSSQRLDVDLEAILLKSLRKEPRERYVTASQFSTDLCAWLDGKPVAARRGTLRYRAGKFIRRHRTSLAGTALLAVTLVAGISGIVWQAKVANEQRRKAEARSTDLRELSNSLLSELDEAIKELPGSTGAQKLLVTRVLEHLDRMATDINGDRQTQLDLVDAYTRLGNLQGNAYDQNFGDPEGGLKSLNKALAIAAPLAASNSRDKDAILKLALVEQSRSEILWQTGRTPEAVPVMREAIKSYDMMAADPLATVAQICDVASAYGTLGDELGQNGTNSLGDSAAAVDAYRKSLQLDERVLSINPSFMRARRGISVNNLKIGSLEMETDPEQAFKHFQSALEGLNAMPQAEQDSLSVVRLRAMLLRKEGDALERSGAFALAAPIFEKSRAITQKSVTQDPKDLRALYDLVVVLDEEATSYEDASDPLWAVSPAERSRNLSLAEKGLKQAAASLARIISQDKTDIEKSAYLGLFQVRIGTIEAILNSPTASEELSRKGLAALRQAAENRDASPLILEQAASAFLMVKPASLKDARFALACAEREVAGKLEQMPFRLLTLARAYRAVGQIEKSRTTAEKGLALLPASQTGKTKSNIRRLLEFQARTASN
jgi:eukaryotic-like serine/threonine-protein kinase